MEDKKKWQKIHYENLKRAGILRALELNGLMLAGWTMKGGHVINLSRRPNEIGYETNGPMSTDDKLNRACAQIEDKNFEMFLEDMQKEENEHNNHYKNMFCNCAWLVYQMQLTLDTSTDETGCLLPMFFNRNNDHMYNKLATS
ncbi:hypothetical protein HELRODRAFT_160555 [Helobdella robusta]|uniref:Uncharacterized protein n=1 Tax=Helobdella robusta TaxID=6412 RepID=T1EQF0_HELRO|nr:hypothetical protein HELRODRAFT_160555 [Helobdella robusta]ESO06387.1 hypothetical protein HELRODRAFT_160555 [Helobdella robusta]